MKKKYLQPCTKVIGMETEQVIARSGDLQSDNGITVTSLTDDDEDLFEGVFEARER